MPLLMSRIAIVASRFNPYVVDRLLKGARSALAEGGVRDKDVSVAWVPGAFEIPAVAARLVEGRRCHAVVTLGCVLKGETPHFDYVSAACAQGVAEVSRNAGIPVTFGVLTCHTLDQALARSGAKGVNRGAHAAQAALEMLELFRTLRGRG